MKKVSKRCERCGKFGAKETRVISLYTRNPFPESWGDYGEWWQVDSETPVGFVSGIPCGPHNAPHAAHANSTFVIETTALLCPECGEEGNWVLLGGKVATCDECGRKRYGAGNNFSHICEECLRRRITFEDITEIVKRESCKCTKSSKTCSVVKKLKI